MLSDSELPPVPARCSSSKSPLKKDLVCNLDCLMDSATEKSKSKSSNKSKSRSSSTVSAKFKSKDYKQSKVKENGLELSPIKLPDSVDLLLRCKTSEVQDSLLKNSNNAKSPSKNKLVSSIKHSDSTPKKSKKSMSNSFCKKSSDSLTNLNSSDDSPEKKQSQEQSDCCIITSDNQKSIVLEPRGQPASKEPAHLSDNEENCERPLQNSSSQKGRSRRRRSRSKSVSKSSRKPLLSSPGPKQVLDAPAASVTDTISDLICKTRQKSGNVTSEASVDGSDVTCDIGTQGTPATRAADDNKLRNSNCISPQDKCAQFKESDDAEYDDLPNLTNAVSSNDSHGNLQINRFPSDVNGSLDHSNTNDDKKNFHDCSVDHVSSDVNIADSASIVESSPFLSPPSSSRSKSSSKSSKTSSPPLSPKRCASNKSKKAKPAAKSPSTSSHPKNKKTHKKKKAISSLHDDDDEETSAAAVVKPQLYSGRKTNNSLSSLAFSLSPAAAVVPEPTNPVVTPTAPPTKKKVKSAHV